MLCLAPASFPCTLSKSLCVPHTWLLCPAPIVPSTVTAISSLWGAISSLRTTHVSRLAGPALLLHRWDWLRASWSPRTPAALNDAAKNGKEDKTTNATGNSNDKVLVVVNPRTDLFGGGGALALTLEKSVSMRIDRESQTSGTYIRTLSSAAACSAV